MSFSDEERAELVAALQEAVSLVDGLLTLADGLFSSLAETDGKSSTPVEKNIVRAIMEPRKMQFEQLRQTLAKFTAESPQGQR